MKLSGKLLGILALSWVAAAPAVLADADYSPPDSGEAAKVAERIEYITDGLVGELGFAATIPGDDTVISLNGDESFPLASTFKVAVAAAILARVDKGELRLDQIIDVTPDMYVNGSFILARNFVHPGLKLSLANMIEVMITESDNTAADILVELAGGPAAVTAYLVDMGIEGLRIDRDTEEAIRDYAEPSGEDDRDPAFEDDPRDHSTPMAMLELLLAIDNGTALSAESRDFILGSMSRTRTGKERLKGMLPPGTPVAHKTGTIGGTANDVGYVTLPDGRRIIVAVFTKGSTTEPEYRDRAIAETARTLYDFYSDR
ncbi:MAG: class A beta-lactamase [Candidatus Zixiibacteriota bacterium]|jgi:beta-lactamase class A